MTIFTPDTRPALPRSLSHGIGIIGAGGIVQHGHLPAYRDAGFRVVGIASRREESVEPVARQWHIPQMFTDWRRLLDLTDLEVVDVTYPFDKERLEIVREASARGKHILMQKPMAHSMDAAREMVELCEKAGVKFAVNQNARWCPQYRAARLAIEQGLLGEPYYLVHEMVNHQDCQTWFNTRWYARQERFQLIEYAVHHLDLLRFWAGKDVTRVKALTGRKPGQTSKGELVVVVAVEFEGGAIGSAIENNAAYPKQEVFARFRIEGTRGVATGQAYGQGEFAIQSDLLPEATDRPPLEGTWFPGAFAGPMGELLKAVEENREPTISGRENLKTLDIIFRAYADAA